MRYSVHVTLNGPRGHEYDYSLEADSLDQVVQHALSMHPECTSMVMALALKAQPVLDPGPFPPVPLRGEAPMDDSGLGTAGFAVGTAKESVHHYLERVYPGELPRILEIMSRESGAESAAYTLGHEVERLPVLSICFVFSQTDEGYDHWWKLMREREGMTA